MGLGDIDGTTKSGGFLEYETQRFSTRLELPQCVDGCHDGLYGETEVMYNGAFDAFSKRVFFAVGPSIAFGEDAYNSTFFKVSVAQSAASGISQHDLGGASFLTGYTPRRSCR
ncbi:MipA/OmpV family protein [Sulfitobacter aquimarinus]|uniref:MipA/OmpV family protein n=1 Tax=Sulfitobacter aquimarinus TaxID=3158557 RepID=UPI003F6FBCF5